MSSGPRILVASDAPAEAELVARLLGEEFSGVQVSSRAPSAADDFERVRPDLLVLAFNTLEKAERWYLGLYRLSHAIHELPHRTLILCNKTDLARVYSLCRSAYFDDYVLFWPSGYDSRRLLMSAHQLCRWPCAAAPVDSGLLVEQARRIDQLERLLRQSLLRGGASVEAAREGLRDAERQVDRAIDDFSRALVDGEDRDVVEVHDVDRLQQRVAELKRQDIATSFAAAAASAQPVREWLGSLGDTLTAPLAAARSALQASRPPPPLVLVVDDDEFQHRLLRHILAELRLELLFATSANEALALLDRRQPQLILMDINLPDLNGVEATRRLKSIERLRSIPVMMITGSNAKQVVVESMRAGAADFVLKPFDKQALIGKLRGCLGDAVAAAPIAAGELAGPAGR